MQISPPNEHIVHDPRYQISGYNDAQHVWNGRLLELPDLDTSSNHVQEQTAGYFERLKGMGVDGFRVDAAKHMSPEDVQTILSKAGNPWTFLEIIGAGVEAAEIQPDRYDHIAHVTEFKYATDVASNFNGQLKHLKTLGENWVSAHDNLTLRDKVLAWADANGVERSSPYLRRIQNFATGVVLTSQGIPFLHGGVEFMRHKQGEHNSYDAGDEINRYHWHRHPLSQTHVNTARNSPACFCAIIYQAVEFAPNDCAGKWDNNAGRKYKVNTRNLWSASEFQMDDFRQAVAGIFQTQTDLNKTIP